MPRPGPRPYEYVRRAWHSDRHGSIRGSTIQQIFRVAHESHGAATKKNKEWLQKLPAVVFKAEEIIYSKANSEAEYMNIETLRDRIDDAIDTIIRRDESTENVQCLPPCIEVTMDRVLNNNHTNNTGTAPFVMKIYQLVSNPSTDHIVAWGSGNNSFIIMDAMHFSQRILPAYFKHNNFSSFVRQLNTYGFRKVDPDQWEFANQWFLRGQDRLLHNITRKKHSRNVTYKREHDMDEDELRKEVSRLKEEQRLLEEELRQMNRRIEAAERRPEQMMTLLYKAIEDPQVLIPRTMLETGYYKNRSLSGEKKRRILVSSGTSSSSSCSYNSSSMAAVSSSGKGEEELAADVVVGCHSPPPRPVPYPFCLLEGSF